MTLRTEIIESLQSLPPVPVVAVRLTRLLRDPDTSVSTLVETIKYDPNLTTQAIKMANSAFFRSSVQVVTLKDALVRLGNTRLLQLVIASSLQPAMVASVDGYCLDPGDLWRHCVAVGVAAEKIEKELGGENLDLAFTLGLLHDIGKLALGYFVDRNSEQIALETGHDAQSFLDVEEKVLGISHTEAGALMLEQWGFPEELVVAVRWHHLPEQAGSHQKLVDLVHLGDAVAMMMGIGLGNDGLCYDLSPGSLERLGLKVHRLESLASQTLETFEEIMKMFNTTEG
ncbi:MAG: HDOD domain-containing protein [Candidatus Glassbacteria bacterium]|nr:HDOD domain-containing protein [Candidatus Glassbacteria bacterium]